MSDVSGAETMPKILTDYSLSGDSEVPSIEDAEKALLWICENHTYAFKDPRRQCLCGEALRGCPKFWRAIAAYKAAAEAEGYRRGLLNLAPRIREMYDTIVELAEAQAKQENGDAGN